MGWILFGMCLLFVIGYRMSNFGKRKDDFAANSTVSYFLLEEFIDESLIEEGGGVQKGQLIAELEDGDLFCEEFN